MSQPSEIVSKETTPSAPTLKQAFWYWLKLGFISFGGPAGQIAIMHKDLVVFARA
jgi:chromate transporter